MIQNSKIKPKMKMIIAALSFFAVLSCSYMPIGNEIPDTIFVEEDKDYILYQPVNGNVSDTGLIFYPGGLVEPHAYDVILSKFAEEGQRVILVKMPLNLAVLSPFKAFKIMDRYPEMKEWIIAGHSLGGAMACRAVQKQPDSFTGLVLLAAYPDENTDISDWDGSAFSISGSEDLITTPQEVEDSKSLLPESIVVTSPSDIPSIALNGKTIYYEIPGANHAQFGNYGPQDGDGEATISGAEQLQKTKEILNTIWANNNWN